MNNEGIRYQFADGAEIQAMNNKGTPIPNIIMLEVDTT